MYIPEGAYPDAIRIGAAALVLPALLNPGSIGSSQSAAPEAHAEAGLPEDRPAVSAGAAPCIPLNVLASLENHSTPVLVFTLAYGADADTESLRAIAMASGAHFYDATDPNRLEAVLGDLVTSF